MKKKFLQERTIKKSPFLLFDAWHSEARSRLREFSDAMTLATSLHEKPNARIIFLRGFDKNGFRFFTNYNSRKGKELLSNPNACLLFFHRLGVSKNKIVLRQINISGSVEKLKEKDSDRYFAHRPRGSQLGAWASPQSEAIANRETLEAWYEAYTRHFKGKKVKRPPHWGGYRLVPVSFEFWQGRENRLHDRILFTKQKSGRWKMQRLAP